MSLQDLRFVRAISARCRYRRLALLDKLLQRLTLPIQLLDVGGTEEFWQTAEFIHRPGIEVLLLNTWPIPTSFDNFRSVVGDARDMSQFRNHAFDVVFSNSVIEHVGSFEDQRRMAREMLRVGKRLFAQTPSRYFPLEPHFLFPFFQFLPVKLRVRLASSFDLGCWKGDISSSAVSRVNSVRLLTKRQLRELFPGAQIHCERVAMLPKSYVLLAGWEE